MNSGISGARWLQLDQTPTHHLSALALAKLDRVGLQYALQQEILASFNCPVVFKNIICGLHTASHGTPSLSLFLYIQRDPLAGVLHSQSEAGTLWFLYVVVSETIYIPF